MRNQTSDLRLPRYNALQLSHRDLTVRRNLLNPHVNLNFISVVYYLIITSNLRLALRKLLALHYKHTFHPLSFSLVVLFPTKIHTASGTIPEWMVPIDLCRVGCLPSRLCGFSTLRKEYLSVEGKLITPQ